jgi:hypothetical protein
MESYSKALVTFVIVYLASIFTRAIVAKEKEQSTFFEGLKDKSNQKTAGIVAFVMAITSFYI